MTSVSDWHEASSETAKALRLLAETVREMTALTRRRADAVRHLAEALRREALACPADLAAAFLRKHSEIVEAEARTVLHEADTLESERLRYEAQAERAERRAAGPVPSDDASAYPDGVVSPPGVPPAG